VNRALAGSLRGLALLTARSRRFERNAEQERGDMRGRDLFDRVEPILRVLTTLLKALPRPVRRRLLVSARGLKGSLGLGLRYTLLAALDITSEPNVSVHENVYLLNTDGLRIGRNVSIHPMCYIDAAGEIELGNDISIAHGTTIMSTSHKFERRDQPINDQETIGSKTVVEDDCWIGAQCVVVSGTNVGSGSVIAANSVLNRDVPPGSVMAGSPAKVVRSRD
jgi:acetyltransferase-like isoleucine patch superfamily enzyme